SAPGMKQRATRRSACSCTPITAKGSPWRPATIAAMSDASVNAAACSLATPRLMRAPGMLRQAQASCRHLPYVGGILPDRAVGGEPRHARGIADRHRVPLRRVAPDRVDLALCGGIGVEIGGDHEPVVVVEPADQIAIAVGVVMREDAGCNGVER